MGTKTSPGQFDCYANAEPNEPMFVLLGRDPSAAFAVRAWIRHRIVTGKNLPSDNQIQEGLKLVEELERWSDNRILSKMAT